MVMDPNWMGELTQLRQKVQEDRAALNYHKQRLDDIEKRTRRETRYETTLKKCRTILHNTALKVQKGVKEYLDKTVSMAEQTSFEDPYQFEAIFETKHNETECRMVFKRNGKERDPLNSTGGGPVDVAAFALRATVLWLSGGRVLLFLDEPFRNTSPDRIPYIINMLESVSKKMDIQIIMITNRTELIRYEGWARMIKIKGGRIIDVKDKE